MKTALITSAFTAVIALATPALAQELEPKEKARRDALAAAEAGSLSAEALFPFDFKVQTLGAKEGAGQELSAESLKGKVVVINIWGTWCGFCQEELPYLQALHQRYKDKLIVLGLGREKAKDPAAMVRAFLKGKKLDYPCALIDDAFLAKVPKFGGFPTTIFLDEKGRVRRILVGGQSSDVLEGTALALMGGAPGVKKDGAKKDESKKPTRKAKEAGPF